MDNAGNLDNHKTAAIIILNCTYADKHKAQKLGATWNNKWRAWCIDDTIDIGLFAKWLPKGE